MTNISFRPTDAVAAKLATIPKQMRSKLINVALAQYFAGHDRANLILAASIKERVCDALDHYDKHFPGHDGSARK